MALRIGDLNEATSFVGTDVFELSLAGSAGSRRVTGSNLRKQLFAGGTGFTATDPLNAGNTVITGTLNVTGASTLAALTAMTGVFSSTLSSSGLTTLASASGSVIVGAAGLAAQSQVILRATAGQSKIYVCATGNLTRWAWGADNSAEAGSDVGSVLVISAYNDAGVFVDQPIRILRPAGGAITLTRPVSMSSTLAVTGATTLSSTLAVAGTLTHSSGTANLVQNTGSSGTVFIGATDSTGTLVSVRTASGGRAQYAYHTGSSLRWSAYKSESAESGSDAGSSWVLAAYNDAGVNIDLPIVITRAASGNMALSRPVIMSSTLAVTGTITASGGIIAGSATNIGWSTRSLIQSPADGILTVVNNAGTGFTRLQFGGTSSSFPALARSSAALQVVLADGSSHAELEALFVEAHTGSGSIPSVGGFRLKNNSSIAWRNAADSGNVTLTLNGSDIFAFGAGAVGPYFGSQSGSSATTGTFRLANNESIAWRNAANSANHTLALSASDVFGLSSNLAVTGQVTGTLLNATTALVGPGTVSTVGSVRLANNESISWRNAANTANISFSVDASNNFNFGANAILTTNGIQQGTGNVAATGWIRMQNLSPVRWRNAAASADIGFFVNGSDRFEFEAGLSVTGLIAVPATQRIYLDGVAASGDTYLVEGVANQIHLVAGGTIGFVVDNDNTAGQTRARIFDNDNATQERISVGAADSGGAGFKVLRIPN